MQTKQKGMEIRIIKEKKEQKIHVIGKGEEGTFIDVCSCSLNLSGLLSGKAMRTWALDFSGNFSIQITSLYYHTVDLKFRLRKMAIRRKVHENKCPPSNMDPADIFDNHLLVPMSILNGTCY